jgi:hypothetical protein
MKASTGTTQPANVNPEQVSGSQSKCLQKFRHLGVLSKLNMSL